MSTNDLYSASEIQSAVAPVSVSGTVSTGTAISTASYDGVFNINLATSTLTGTMQASLQVQASGVSGWADISGNTAVVTSGTSGFVAQTYASSNDGAYIRPVITSVSGPFTVSSVVIAPKKVV